MRAIPETLAVRAVNEWRRYDVVAHLGLRLYLDNRCAVRDRWAYEVAAREVAGEKEPCYHGTLHFKERRKEDGGFEFRRIHIPAPNEILAEAALLHQCSLTRRGMRSADCVYSYRLPHSGDRRGVVVPYFEGFRQRHDAIAAACERNPKGVVVYTDIRRFYASITTDVAMTAWGDCARAADLGKWAEELGYNLLEKHAKAGESVGEQVLTGPMFTHLLANLMLRRMDQVMQEALPGGYFRYVDDFALVGDASAIRRSESVLSRELDNVKLTLNPKKGFEVPAAHWLGGKGDFGDDASPASWKIFVGSMRQMALHRPDCIGALSDQLRDAGFRIVPLDYSAAVKERTCLWRTAHLWERKSWRSMTRKQSVRDLVRLGLDLRKRYREMYERAISDAVGLQGYDRKRRIHSLRHSVGRLVYLEEPGRLGAMARSLGNIHEMELFAAVYDAVVNTDVTNLIHYGVNGAQAAAQPLKAIGHPLRCCCQKWSESALQGRAVLLAHGLKLDEQDSAPVPSHPMTAFCGWLDGPGALAAAPGTFFGRLACLHGRDEARRHATILGTAFDVDDNLAFEMDYVMQESS